MNLKSKFRGALLGTGIGDSLGRSCEGRNMRGEEEVRALAEEFEILRYTDDTQQMMALGESITESEEFDEKCFAEKLVENFDPSRGYGPGSTQVIKSIKGGKPWDEPAKEIFGGEGSYGNGSSMRVAPIGLFAHNQLEDLRSLAERSSRVTHVHRLGVEGAILQASSVALATGKTPSPELNAMDFLENVRDFVREDEYKKKLDIVEEFLNSDPSRSRVIRSLGNGIEAPNSVPTALYSFLSHPESFEDAVLFAIGLGGDTDTIGAMTGAIAGAYRGEEEIPTAWRDKLEEGDRIIKSADGLFEVKL